MATTAVGTVGTTPAAGAAGAVPAASAVGDVKELRLALVCYGGVSLAVYMHGMTKELFKLALASAALDAGRTENPFGANDTAGVYYDLLSRMQSGELGPGPTGVRTRVVIDIVSGTSAGGINGVCLAKALACNTSLDALKALWMDKGDIGVLLRGPKWMPAKLRAMAFASRSATKMTIAPPLKGDDMCAWLHGAFRDMDASTKPLTGASTLVPLDHTLELFVPVTDFHGFRREVPVQDPHYLHERGHRHVMTFAYDDPEHHQFGDGCNHALAFAARATSSFPGAFPPITIDGYRKAVGDGNALGTQLDVFFPQYALGGAPATASVFIDGGVLDNFPFQTSIDAISRRPAASEVDRRLLYLEPDPSHALDGAAPSGPDMPSWIGTVWGGIAGIPRQEPILDDLQRLAARNDVVQRVRDIIETSFETISDRVDSILAPREGAAPVELPPRGDGDALVRFRRALDARVADEAGFAYATYVRLRILDVVDGFAATIASTMHFPDSTYHAAFVRSIMREWVRGEGLLAHDAKVSEAQEEFLAAFDLGYQERRARFLLAAFSWWYRDCGNDGYPTRIELDHAKERIYRRLGEIDAIRNDLAADESIVRAIRTVFDPAVIRTTVLEAQADAHSFVEQHASELEIARKAVAAHVASRLPDIEARLHADVLDVIVPWSVPVQGAFLTRYVGFGFWDALVFPVAKLAGVGERDAVEVLRMSPRDVKLLTSPDKEKLKGASLGHFGAFFSRPGRECDYLWGRLDAAERLIALLLDDPATPAMEPPSPAEVARCFRAILDDERNALPAAAKLIAALDPQVANLH